MAAIFVEVSGYNTQSVTLPTFNHIFLQRHLDEQKIKENNNLNIKVRTLVKPVFFFSGVESVSSCPLCPRLCPC